MNLFLSRKDVLCSEITHVYEGMVQSAESRVLYAKSWSDIGSTSCAMLTSQIPELKAQFEEMRTIFNEVYQIHFKLAKEIERSAEDIRDVYERFDVLFRVNEEYNIRKEQLADATRKLTEAHAKIEAEKAKGTYQKNEAKLLANLEAARKDKTDALRRIKRKVKQLMAVKDSYNKFKVKRFRQGFTRYSHALREAAQSEIQKLTQIREFLAALSVDDPTAASAVGAMVQQNLESQVQDFSVPNTETYTNDGFRKEEYGDAKEEEKPSSEPLFGDGENGPLFPPEEENVKATPLFDGF